MLQLLEHSLFYGPLMTALISGSYRIIAAPARAGAGAAPARTARRSAAARSFVFHRRRLVLTRCGHMSALALEHLFNVGEVRLSHLAIGGEHLRLLVGLEGV